MRWAVLAAALLLTGCESELRPLAQGLDEALLAVQGDLADLWVVGSDRGSGPAVWHHTDGWERISTGLEGDAWWVLPLPDEVVVVGAGGLLAELDRASGSFTRIEGPDPEVTFFGVWGASADDVWAVGGVVGGEQPPVLWRRLVGSWARLEDPALAARPGVVAFKVHGLAADDFWVVGSRGMLLHGDGGPFTAVDSGTEASLFTVVDRPAGAVVVGGLGSGLILEEAESGWVDRSPTLSSTVNGVCAAEDRLHAVGRWGSVHQREEGGWRSATVAATAHDFHGCWVDAAGNLVAVGGHVSSEPLTNGMILSSGPTQLPLL